jgi:hypothetical protein
VWAHRGRFDSAGIASLELWVGLPARLSIL